MGASNRRSRSAKSADRPISLGVALGATLLRHHPGAGAMITSISSAFVVGGTSSGTGKTTVALGLMAALRVRGLAVQPFKCGPDFVDPSHHGRVCQRSSRNLDTWMIPPTLNRNNFDRHSTNVAVSVVEGVMGLFDGAGQSSDLGSTADTARLLDLPVVLVMDASRMSTSAAAIVHGFATFDRTLRLVGVIFNKVANESHYDLLSGAVQELAGIRSLGYLPRDEHLRIPERQLGLITAGEYEMPEATIAYLASLVENHIEVDLLLALSTRYASEAAESSVTQSEPSVRIGVAQDRAFCFYYEDNLDALRAAGAELVPFSPLSDSGLPPGLNGLYIGGGYPEVWAESLSDNRSMRAAVARFIGNSGVVYAECGGLMYLARSLRTMDGTNWSMVGALPIHVAMTDRLQRFGYVEVTFSQDCLLGAIGTTARGHSFHYSRIENTAENLACAYQLHYPRTDLREAEGFVIGRVLASYVHLHFASNGGLAAALVNKHVVPTPRRVHEPWGWRFSLLQPGRATRVQ